MRLGDKEWSGAPNTLARASVAPMRMGDKEWSCAPGTIARQVAPAAESKSLTIIEDGTFAALTPGIDSGFLPRTTYDYRSDVREGFDSNVIMAPTFWIMRTFTEAVARVKGRTKGRWAFVEDHDAELLLERPNDFYNGDALWKATCISYVLNGNAYWLKVRNVFGEVIQLWYVPHWLMTPRWPSDGSRFISYYEYRTGFGKPEPIPPRDVIHFRFGLDPRNPRYGFSSLRPLLREVFTDDEASNFSAQILRNMGVPGLLISPKINVSPADQAALKAYMQTAATGDNRGDTMVMGVPTDVVQFGFDPNKLMLPALRDISEERVCAVLGLPAAVVGFGSGQQSTKVGATMRELRRLAWIQCLTPMQTSLARELTAQLLPDFVAQVQRFCMQFDMSGVTAFQEEEDAKAARICRVVVAGVLRVDRAQEELGLEVDETQKVYLRPANTIAIGEDGKPVEPPKPASAQLAPGTPTPPAVVDPAAPPADKALAALALRATGNGHVAHDDG